MRPALTLSLLKKEAANFLRSLTGVPIPKLYGVTDRKAIGTYVELSFNDYLRDRFTYVLGSAASGIDFPELGVDLKVTSARQPQSSSPYTEAAQKVYGLGYHLMVFVYTREDDSATSAARLQFQKAIFIARERTADYQTTYGLRRILEQNGNRDDLVAYLEERNLPLDEIGRQALAERILQSPPQIGCLTMSNALQWRLQYTRAIDLASSGAMPEVETSLSRDLGDFQTPPALVSAVLSCLSSFGPWERAIEPTCGRGNFLTGLLSLPTQPKEIHAFELQDNYVDDARRASGQIPPDRVHVQQANIFDVDFHHDLRWNEQGRLLVVGNPPWVTNSELGALDSRNRPGRSNLKGLKGLDALTGCSNFDIAEYIWIKLMGELAHEAPSIALLCKTSVARNVLQYAAEARLPIRRSFIRRVESQRWFEASVESCLFYVQMGADPACYQATVYPSLESVEPESIIGIVRGRMVADVAAHERSVWGDGVCPLVWRQGIKHDAASIMELDWNANTDSLRNRLGEPVMVESSFIYPLLKSSDLFHAATSVSRKRLIVPQRRLGEDTRVLETVAPQLWAYLDSHAAAFDRRKSSIYRGKAPFAIFGVGDYSFAPFKVAISGLHKAPRFRAIGPIGGRPVMLDDTCYFLPCDSPVSASLLAGLLNHSICMDLINALAFWDSKRPITKQLLQRIDLHALLDRIDLESLSQAVTSQARALCCGMGASFMEPSSRRATVQANELRKLFGEIVSRGGQNATLSLSL